MDKKLLATMMVFIIAACALFAVVDQSEADGTKTLVIETSPDFAPYDYLYGDEFAGIDMDIIRAVCKEIGYKPQFRQNNFDSIIMSVQQHKTDMGASGFTIDEDRKKNVDFTESYTTVKQVVVVLKDSPIKTLEDVKGKRISVQTGTTGAKYAEGVTGIDNISYQKGYPEVVLDILNKKADCEIVDDAVAKAQVANNPKLEIRDILTDAETEYYGFIFAKDNTALYNLFNDALKKLIADGTVGKILDYYADNGYSENTPPYNFSKNKKLVVETSPDFPPYEYLLGEEYVGIDMDIVRAIADRLGYTVEFRQNNFDSIIMSVQQHKTDFGASGFTIDEDRKAQVNFSTPYAEIKQVVVVKKNSPISDLEDVKGKKISVQSGTSGAAYAEGVSSNIIYQKSYNEVLLDVLKGKADCEIVDRPVAEAQVANNPELEIRDILIDAETEYYGLIFAKDNTEMYTIINDALERIIANGTVDKIVKYYADKGFSTDTPSYFNQGGGSTGGDDDDGEDDGFFATLWKKFKKDFLDNDRYNYIFKGLKNTLTITILALIIGMGIGAVAAMVRSTHDQTGRFPIANAICRLYITVIRGTPVMVQLLIIYYVVFASVNLNQILIASVAFGLNSGAYVAEVFRSGINSVPKGQMEACRSLGMNNGQAMKKVIMPQALRNILPALGNEGISLLKETSVAGYIGIVDLTRAGDLIRGQTYDALLPLLVVALIYLAIVLVLTYLVKRLERRLNNAY